MPNVGGINGGQLKSFIERIERLEEEISDLNNDKKEVYAEAKGTGFDTKIMKQIIKIRRMDKDDLDEQETLLEIYKQALGMLPLFEAAEEPEEEAGTPVATRARARAPATEEPARSVEEIAATIAATEAPLGSDVTVTLVSAKEEMPASAILAAGASAAARGEPEDNCPHAGERNRELWLQGHREWSARRRNAA